MYDAEFKATISHLSQEANIPVYNRGIVMYEPLEYEWVSLIDYSEKSLVEISKMKAEVVAGAVGIGVITEDETREMLSGDEFFGELGDLPDIISQRQESEMDELTSPPDEDIRNQINSMFKDKK